MKLITKFTLLTTAVIFLTSVTNLSYASKTALDKSSRAKLGTNLSKIWEKNARVIPHLDKDGAVVIQANYHQPIMVCKLGFVCTLEFPSGEVLVNSGALLLGTDNWEIVVNSFQNLNDEYKTILAFRPLARNSETTLMVVTNYKVYNFKLISNPKHYILKSKIVDRSRKSVNNENVVYAGTANNKVKALEKEIEKLRIQLSRKKLEKKPGKINKNYKILANKSIKWRPLVVYDDSIETTIELSKHFKKYNPPRVVAIINDSEVAINFTFNDGVIKIVGVYEKIYLNSNAQRVFVINDNY